jgi:hypothetical protein
VGAGDALSLHELKVSSRLGEHRRKAQRQASAGHGHGLRGGSARGAGGGAAVEELDVSEAELRGVPVLWVQVRVALPLALRRARRVGTRGCCADAGACKACTHCCAPSRRHAPHTTDTHTHTRTHTHTQLNPGLEWLSAVQLKQPAHWWSLQLEHSKDVVAQAQAVAGLAAQLGGGSGSAYSAAGGGSYEDAAAAGGGGGGGRSPQQAALDGYVISILAGVMRNAAVFCRCGRVRGCWRAVSVRSTPWRRHESHTSGGADACFVCVTLWCL